MDRYQQHLATIASAATALADNAAAAGLDARVPTCPAWTVADLVTHLGVVHRWARGNLCPPAPSPAEIQQQVPREHLIDWLRAGAESLLAAFAAADPDQVADGFLADAPPPLQFWARRQAHETTIHSIDALAARLGRLPWAAEADLDCALAHDGVDELLRGFLTRRASQLANGEEYLIHVLPSDADDGWVIRIGAAANATDRARVAVPDLGPLDAAFGGTSAQLYLGLWNRGDEITASGRPEVLTRWHQEQRV